MTGRPGEAPLDAWSIVHVAGGLACGLVVRNPLAAVAVLVAYEVFEAGLRRVRPRGAKGGLFEHESWTNIRHDILLGSIGWLFAQGMPRLDVWPF